MNFTQDVSEICGASFCPMTTSIPSTNKETSYSTVMTLMSIYLVFGLIAIAVVFFFLDKIDIVSENKGKGCCHLFIATFKHLKNRNMQLLIPLTLFSGLEQGFVFADFTKVWYLFVA